MLIEAMGAILVAAGRQTFGTIFLVRNGLNVILYLTLAIALLLPDHATRNK